jgi:hypothetical protein
MRQEQAIQVATMFSIPANANSEPRTLLEGELLDLYVAILIVVPLAFFLKSLWF